MACLKSVRMQTWKQSVGDPQEVEYLEWSGMKINIRSTLRSRPLRRNYMPLLQS
jgi:hypothetical protein